MGKCALRRWLYTREILQGEADRWSAILRTYDYEMPAERIILYTSGRQFESAIGEPPARRVSSVWGMAAWSKEGTPIVYVKLGLAPLTIGYDPLTILIHELLHHVTPALDHDWVYELAGDFRKIDKALRPTMAPNVEEVLGEVETSPEPTPPLRRAAWEHREQRWLEALDRLRLTANGSPPQLPPRSRLTGRFVRRDRVMSSNHPARPRLKPFMRQELPGEIEGVLEHATAAARPGGIEMLPNTRRNGMTEPVWKTSAQRGIRGARSIHASLDPDGSGRPGDVTSDGAFRQAVEAYARHRKEVASPGALATHLSTDHRIIQAFSYTHPQGNRPVEGLSPDDLDYTHWEEHGGQGMEEGIVLSHEAVIARRVLEAPPTRHDALRPGSADELPGKEQ